MATSHTLDNGATVKVRHPLAPLGLGILTLGIYSLYWYYTINDELRSQGEEVNPVISLLAVTLGALLLVPPIVSMYNTASRIQRVQQRVGVTDLINPVLALVLLVIPLANIFQTAYLQLGLNAAWQRAASGAGTVSDTAPLPASPLPAAPLPAAPLPAAPADD